MHSEPYNRRTGSLGQWIAKVGPMALSQGFHLAVKLALSGKNLLGVGVGSMASTASAQSWSPLPYDLTRPSGIIINFQSYLTL